MLNVSTVSASVKMALNPMDPVALTSTNAEPNPTSAVNMLTALTYLDHSDVNACLVMWERHPEFNARPHAKMLSVANTLIVNRMAQTLTAFVRKVGHTIPKILLPVVLRSTSVTLPENVLARLVTLVSFFLCQNQIENVDNVGFKFVDSIVS